MKLLSMNSKIQQLVLMFVCLALGIVNASGIPKTFHTIWFDFGQGTTVFPEYQARMNRLLELHPGWTMTVWNEDDVDELISVNMSDFYFIWSNYDVPIKKHDAARAAILYVHGGVYVDHDFIPLRNIEPLLENYDFVAAYMKGSQSDVSNAFMAFKPHTEFMSLYINQMSRPAIFNLSVVNLTGPVRLGITVTDYLNTVIPENIKILDSKYFYEVDWPNRFADFQASEADLLIKYPDCFLLHKFDWSWENQIN